MNKFEFLGRLSQEPTIRQTQNGGIVFNCSIAVNRKFKQEGQPTADFFNLVAFGKTAEFMQKYMNNKGQQILVDGHIQNRSWEQTDETTGEITKRYTTDFIVDNCYFADSKKETSGDMQFENTSSNEIPSIPADELPF